MHFVRANYHNDKATRTRMKKCKGIYKKEGDFNDIGSTNCNSGNPKRLKLGCLLYMEVLIYYSNDLNIVS